MRAFLVTVLLWSCQLAPALDLDRLDEAELELEALVTEWEGVWNSQPSEENSAALGASLQALGVIERQQGKPREALEHLNRACELLADAPSLPDALEALALTHQDLGQLDEADQLLGRVLDVRRSDHEQTEALATTLDHLALIRLQQGRYPEVGPLLDEAIRTLSPSAVELRARMQGHRGRLLHTLGSHARALQAFDDALALGSQNPGLRLSLRSQRALALLRLGRTEEATDELDAVAELARNTFSSQPLLAVPHLNNLGAVALALGRPEEAEAAFAEAVEVTESHLGKEHPGLIPPLNNLGVARQQLGKLDSAADALERALSLQKDLRGGTSHLRVSETLRNLARNALLTQQADRLDHVDNATKSGLSLLDSLVKQGSERDRLNFLERFDLVSLPCITGDAEAIANVLLASKSRLLDAMLGETEHLEIPTWKDIQAALPAKSAFVDTCRYRPLDTEAGLQYGAVLILPQGPPRWFQLGSERDLLDWLEALRERLAWQATRVSGNDSPAPALKLQSILKGLEMQFWKPFASAMPPDTNAVAFSADGALHFLPLAALLNADGIPLSHRLQQVCSVASGRSLIASQTGLPIASTPWTVMTISDFPSPQEQPDADTLAQLLAGLHPMPGTAREASSLKRLAPAGSQFLADEQVTETAIHSLAAPPGVLHLGCHAFYIGPERLNSDLALDFDENAQLLRSSGLVLFHGPQRAQSGTGGEDDLLFPDEIARLPLDGTRLVTLSSCESGAGTPVGGEGILGLHRAFAQAGADEVAVALWPVSDLSTPAFMERFYQLAKHSDRTAQALWQTQSEFIPEAEDPEFETSVLRYAPFNLSQNGPLAVGPAIDLPPLKPSLPWGALALAIGLAALTRWAIKRLQAQRAATR